MGEFHMPSLGADMEYGTLLEWRVKPGDAVKRGDIVAVVDTSKAEIEVEIFQDGTIEQLLVGEGTRVPVGTVLATLTAPGEPAHAAPTEPSKQPRISPVARRTAEQLGVDASTVHGTGPAGAITMADVQRAAASQQAPASLAPEVAQAAQATAGETPTAKAEPPTPPAEPQPSPATEAMPASAAERQAAMRHAIGALMARSKREIPHYYLQSAIDMSSALQWLAKTNEARPISERLLPAALLLGAVARAAQEMPMMNGFWIDDAFQRAENVHLGVAVSLRGSGLVAPAIRETERKSIDELMNDLRDLVRRARTGVLRGSEMSDPTITVTNLGDLGAEAVHGVIYPPQVALVGFGAVRERPWADRGMLGVRPIVTATLAGDHRASDGADGSRFLALIEQHLQRPEDLAR